MSKVRFDITMSLDGYVAGPNDVEHTVWRLSARDDVAAFQAAFDALDALYIADGHHRSAAAARVRASTRPPE